MRRQIQIQIHNINGCVWRSHISRRERLVGVRLDTYSLLDGYIHRLPLMCTLPSRAHNFTNNIINTYMLHIQNTSLRHSTWLPFRIAAYIHIYIFCFCVYRRKVVVVAVAVVVVVVVVVVTAVVRCLWHSFARRIPYTNRCRQSPQALLIALIERKYFKN